jgi:hypothetical protein
MVVRQWDIVNIEDGYITLDDGAGRTMYIKEGYKWD